MSFTPIKGTEGTVKIGPLATPAAIGKVRNWTYKSSRTVETLPPHVGDPDEVDVPTGKKDQLDFEMTIPSGRDVGQQDIIDAYNAATNDRLEFVATGGYTVVFATPVYKELEISLDAKGTQVLKASVTGAGDVDPSV